MAGQGDSLFYTWATQAETRGYEIVGGEGARFELRDGRWMWDLESQVYNVTVGHQHPHIKARIAAQLDRVPAAGPHAELPIRHEAARRLCASAGMHKAFLATGGSEAVENAIKISMLVTGRAKVICRRHSYHGATLAVLGVSGDPRREPFAAHLPAPLLIDDPFPHPDANTPSAWVRSLDALLQREGPESIAAILLEGLTGTNGMQEPPADFWPAVRARCDAHGIVLIDDEIFSGVGRTGRMWAAEHWGVKPDLMTIGKGITSGYAPLSGVLCNEAISAHFDDHPLVCGLTHYAHPLSCAAAVATLDVLERESLIDNAQRVGGLFRAWLEAQQSRFPAIRSVRGRGLMLGLEFDRDTAPLRDDLSRRGAFVPGRGAMVFLCPPLCLRAEQLDELCEQVLGPAIEAWLA